MFRSPHKYLSSPHKPQAIHQSSPKHVQYSSQTRGKPQVACALFVDLHEEKVKRSSRPGKAPQLGSGQEQTQHQPPSEPSKPPLRFHEWRQQKLQQAAAVSAPQPQPARPTPSTAAATTTLVAPSPAVPPATAHTTAVTAAAGGASVMAAAASVKAVEHTSEQAVGAVNTSLAQAGPLAATTDNLLELQATDWLEPVPYMIGAPEDAAAPMVEGAQGLISGGALEAGAAAAQTQASGGAMSTTDMQGGGDVIAAAVLERLGGALAQEPGPGSAAASAALSEVGVRRSVLGPLEQALGNAVSEAWRGTAERVVAAVDAQLPDIQDVPGGERLQELAAGIKQLGDSLSASMSASWSTSPTITKVLAYCAATLGVLLLVRSPKPAAVQQGPRKQGPPAMVPVPGGSSAGQGPGAASTPGLWDKGGALGGFLAALGAEWQQAGQAPQALPPQLEPPLQQQQAQAEAGSSGGAGAEGCRGGQGERALEPGAGSQQGPGHSAQSPDQLRRRIRALLAEATQALGPMAPLMPGGEEPIRRELDALLQQLELTAMVSSSSPRPTVGPEGENSRRSSSDSVNSSINTPRATRWEGAGLGVAQWDSWERNTGTREWDSRTPIGTPPPPPDPRLLGAWQLEYASTAQLQQERALLPPPSATTSLALLMQLMGSIPGFGMDGIVQHLWEDPGYNKGVLNMASTAVFRLGPLGSLRLSARGGWRDDLRSVGRQGACAQAWFETLSVQPLSLLGFTPDEGILPEVVVPLPSHLQEPTDWCTTYLDADSRIARGVSGTYLFRKLPPASERILSSELAWSSF